MDKKLEEKVKKQIVGGLERLIEESWTMIKASMDRAAVEASMAGKDKLKFPISMKATLEPCGDDCRVEVNVSWGTRCRLNSEPVTVSAQPELKM
jgi:hypothetical protein